jgi:membrane associated rhomboid family serine protease
MGIHDRDYARAGAPRNAGGGIGARLTVVHWLIIINVAVFAFDVLFPKQIHVGLGTAWVEGVDRSRPTFVDETSPQTLEPGLLGYRIVQQDPATGAPKVVGFERFTVMPVLQGIGHFSTLKAFTHLEIWRFLSYQFLHANVTHIAFNMIGLWVFGPVVLRALGSTRMFLAFYMTCGIFGAFLYLILNLLGWQLGALPGLLITQPWMPLVGASASIFGVLMASAKVAGDDVLEVFFVIPMKTRVAAYVFFAISAANLLVFRGQNMGGDAAHIGGALAGFWLIRKPHLLLDFFDDFLGSPRRESAGGKRGGASSRVDRILEKVSRDGMAGLTDRERKILARETERNRGVR